MSEGTELHTTGGSHRTQGSDAKRPNFELRMLLNWLLLPRFSRVFFSVRAATGIRRAFPTPPNAMRCLPAQEYCPSIFFMSFDHKTSLLSTQITPVHPRAENKSKVVYTAPTALSTSQSSQISTPRPEPRMLLHVRNRDRLQHCRGALA